MGSLPLSDDCPLVNVFSRLSQAKVGSEPTYTETVESADRKLQIKL